MGRHRFPDDLRLRGERVVLRPDRAEDAPALTAILAEPEVARWWGTNDEASVRQDVGSGFVILIEDVVQGWLQCSEETHRDYRHVAFDIALSTACQNRGYGTEALRIAIRYLVEMGHHRFTIDPSLGNERAIRAYSAIGFKPVGVMRAYERGPDGNWRDSLLMDLLAPELAG